MESNPAPASTGGPRAGRRLLVSAVAGALFLSAAAYEVVRGSYAENTPRTPAASSEGAVVQLLAQPVGRKVVRCALVVDTPIERAWATVTAYHRFEEIFPWMHAVRYAPETDGRYRLEATIRTPFGSLPMTVRISHSQQAERCEASWDERADKVRVNRGRWLLTRLDAGRTLLEYDLEAEVSPFPVVAVRAWLLDHVEQAVLAIGTDLAKGNK